MSDLIIDQQNEFDDTDFLYEEFLKTQSDYTVAFNSREDFMKALLKNTHERHNIAKTIWLNFTGHSKKEEEPKLHIDYKWVEDQADNWSNYKFDNYGL